MGDSNSALFWVVDLPLCHRFPRPFSVATDPNVVVRSCGRWSDGNWVMVITWRR